MGQSDPIGMLRPVSGGGVASGTSYILPAFPAMYPTALKPCPGNPLPGMAIAEQTNSGKHGGRFGPNRTDEFGNPKDHLGTDLLTTEGQNIYSMYPGTVEYVGYEEEGLGHYLVVKTYLNGRNIFTYYGHLNPISIPQGTIIAVGALIGTSGTSGNLAEAIDNGYAEQHSHIIIRDQSITDPNGHVRGKKVNPEDYFSDRFGEEGNRDFTSDCSATMQ